jgi:NTP pyrophosphatase (non-canonical NTP hydrolase)
MTQLVYIVQAYRWGDRDSHSYTVGVFSNEHQAVSAAGIEEAYRGGKYTCEVLGWDLNSRIATPGFRVVEVKSLVCHRPVFFGIKEDSFGMSLFDDYSDMTERTAQYPVDRELEYLTLGLVGEAGEVANKVKKILRGDPNNPPDSEIAKEIGDLLWYADRLCTYLGSSLQEVMQQNIDKLEDRLKRGTIKGTGDSR